MSQAILGRNIGETWQINTSTCFLQQTLRHPHAFATSPQCSRISPNRASSISSRTVAALQARSAQRVQHDWHVLPDGTKLEVLTQYCDTDTSSAKPPLLMLHGAGHAAWCYKENFMPYFADRGYDTYAISFRCQGSSDMQHDAKFAGTLESHSADIQHFVTTLPKPPVILAHSLGGLIAQRFVLGEQDNAPSAEAASIAGLVLIGSSPPYGTSSLVWRTFRRRPFFSIRLTWGFIKRSYARSMPLFRDMFMSSDIPEKDLERYYQLLQENMTAVQLVDFSQLNKQELPLQRPGPNFAIPVLALCGDQDLIVDTEAAEETAAHFGQGKAIELKGMAHDLMLDTQWQQAASTILEWLQKPDKAA